MDRQEFDRWARRFSRYPLLEREEETRLVLESQAGSKRATDKLVLHNQRLIIKIVMQYRRFRLSQMDLLQEGNLGFITGLKSYKPDRERANLQAFIKFHVRQKINDFIVDNLSVMRAVSDRAIRSVALGHKAAGAQISEQDRALITAYGGGGHVRDINRSLSSNNDLTLADILPDHDSPRPDEVLEQTQKTALQKRVVAQALSSLTQRQRELVHHCLLDQDVDKHKKGYVPLKSLAGRYGVSKQALSHDFNNALHKMRNESALFQEQVL